VTALLAALLLSASPAGDRTAVLAVHDPPAADGELTELAHQLRAAATERAAGVLGAPEMRDRLAGRSGGASAQELDRAFGGALAVYQNGELDSAARTLQAIVDDLEDLPESEAVWFQWTRAMARLSHVYLSMNRLDELEATQVALLKVDSSIQLDPTLYAPGFRARFDEVRQKVRAMPKRRLTVTARGRAGTIYVSGRDVGPTPATVILPAGAYRVGGAAGALRIPSFAVDLSGEDRSVVLDFALAEAMRPSAGPGMLLPPVDRAPALIRAGAWLGVDRLVAVSRATEGGAQFLVGATYDVRRGALLREGSVRIASGTVPPQSLGALASFLLTGQPSRDVLERGHDPVAAARPAQPPPRPPAPAVAGPAKVAPPPPSAAPSMPPPPPPKLTAPRQPAAPEPALATATATAAATTTARGPAASPPPPVPPPPTPHATPTVPLPTAPTTLPAPPAPLPTLSARPGRGVEGRARALPAPRPAPPVAPATAFATGPAPTVATTAATTPTPQALSSAAPDLRPVLPQSPAGGLADPPPPPAAWRRPTAFGTAVLAAVLAGVAVRQERSAQRDWRRADAMIGADGILEPLSRAAYQRAKDDAGAERRNAWLAGSAAAVSAVTSAVLFWSSRDPAPAR